MCLLLYNALSSLLISQNCKKLSSLTHWGRVMHICNSELTIIGLDNGFSPSRPQANIWLNAGILLIRPLGANFNEIVIEIHTFSFKKILLKMFSGKWRAFCLGHTVLKRVLYAVSSIFSGLKGMQHPNIIQYARYRYMDEWSDNMAMLYIDLVNSCL